MATEDKLTDYEMVLSATNTARLSDMFNVEFYGIPENVANIMGKQVRSTDRLNIQFDSTKVRGNRGKMRSHKDQTNFDPLNMSFFEDENGVVEAFIMSHVFRQNNRMTDLLDREDDPDRIYKFDVKINMFNTAGKVTSGLIYKNCFFTSITLPMMSYDDDSRCIISVMIDYDDVDVLVVDRYINMKRSEYV